MMRQYFFFALMAFSLPLLMAAEDVTVLELNYLSGAEALDIVQPFLGEDVPVSAHGQALILQADAARIAAVKEILAAVDRAPQPLRITVRYQAADRPAPGGLDGRSLIAETRPQQREQLTQTLQVADGRWAEISAGETHPLLERTLAIGPRGAAMDERVVLLDLTSGFRVLPRRRGDSVTLDIAARHDAGPTVENNAGTQLLTVLHARLGEWTELGGSQTGLPAQDGGLRLSTRPAGPQLTRVFLRVDPL